MKKIKKIICLEVLLILHFAVSAFAGQLYVSTRGDDSNPGTKDQPLASLARAREVVREMKAKVEEPIKVFVRGGGAGYYCRYKRSQKNAGQKADCSWQRPGIYRGADR